MAPKLSVIVPVYNASSWLRRCVDSVLEQPFRDFELILVDDGSRDSSGTICDEFAARDGRVQVIHQVNTGVSAARNVGIKSAQGEYLQFVDSDDWLEENYSGALLAAAEQSGADVVIAGFRTVQEMSYSSKKPPEYEIRQARELAEAFDPFYFSMLLNSPCNKVYRRELVQVGFPEDVEMGEDLLFNMAFLERVNTVSVTDADGYCYRQSESGGSACASFSRYSAGAMLRYCGSVRPFLERWLPKERADGIYDRILFHSLCNNLNMLCRPGRDDRDSMGAYLRSPEIRESVRRADLSGFPKSKQMVGLCLKARLDFAALAGIRAAARRR